MVLAWFTGFVAPLFGFSHGFSGIFLNSSATTIAVYARVYPAITPHRAYQANRHGAIANLCGYMVGVNPYRELGFVAPLGCGLLGVLCVFLLIRGKHAYGAYEADLSSHDSPSELLWQVTGNGHSDMPTKWRVRRKS